METKEKELMISELKNGKPFSQMSWQAHEDRDIVLAAVKIKGSNIEYAYSEMLKDREIVLEAAKTYGAILEHRYLPDKFRRDKEIVITALKDSPGHLVGAHIDLRNDPEFVTPYIQKFGSLIKDVGLHLRDDFNVVKEAVKSDAYALQYASDRLRDNREIVLAAISQGGNAGLRFASDRLRNDKEVAMEAIKSDPFALYHCSDKLKDDSELVKFAVDMKPFVIRYASPRLQREYNEKEMGLSQEKGWGARTGNNKSHGIAD